MSTDQHVAKTLRIIPVLQVTMSPPPHISYLLLLTTTCLQVNTSSKPSDLNSTTGQHVPTSPYILFSITAYHSSTGQHVITILRIILYYRSSRRENPPNPQNHTNTTGHHVTTSPYISFSTTTYHRSTGQHVIKILRTTLVLQVTMSTSSHVSYLLLLPTTGLQVNTSSKSSEPH